MIDLEKSQVKPERGNARRIPIWRVTVFSPVFFSTYTIPYARRLSLFSSSGTDYDRLSLVSLPSLSMQEDYNSKKKKKVSKSAKT